MKELREAIAKAETMLYMSGGSEDYQRGYKNALTFFKSIANQTVNKK
ncbi:unnamed protein product [marine sediment metagenome]|uniref:HEPN domain-containing protein n=1 Tax=marine sediment metagenome TaxID=412755 RepID=X1V6W2_9ZZZZ